MPSCMYLLHFVKLLYGFRKAHSFLIGIVSPHNKPERLSLTINVIPFFVSVQKRGRKNTRFSDRTDAVVFVQSNDSIHRTFSFVKLFIRLSYEKKYTKYNTNSQAFIINILKIQFHKKDLYG